MTFEDNETRQEKVIGKGLVGVNRRREEKLVAKQRAEGVGRVQI